MIDDDVVIHTPTIEDYVHLLKHALENGYEWNSGCRTVLEKYWDKYKSETCVNIRKEGLIFNRRTYYINNGYNIKSIEEFRYNFRYKELLHGFI